MRLDDNFGKRDAFDEFKGSGQTNETGLVFILALMIGGIVALFFAVERPSMRNHAAASTTAAITTH